MRFFERDRRTVWLRRRRMHTDAYGERIVDWEAAVPLRVALLPVKGGLLQRMYGLCVPERRALYYDGPEAVLEGDGFCLQNGECDTPDFRAVAVTLWDGYQRVEIERADGMALPPLRAPGELVL